MSKYTDLITSYHASKPKFFSHIDLITQPFTDIISATTGIIAAYDLDTAVGSQLDVVGLWIGRSRILTTPLTGVYFSLDTSGLGFDQGVWQGPYDPTTGLMKLSDDVYRIMLRAKIAINKWDGTGENLASIIDTALTGSGIQMFVVDNGDMTISQYVIESSPGSTSKELIGAIRNGYLTVKAAGVGTKGNIQTPSTGTTFFGFDMATSQIAGFDVGAWSTNL